MLCHMGTAPLPRRGIETTDSSNVHRLSRGAEVAQLTYEASAVDAEDVAKDLIAIAKSRAEQDRREWTARRRALLYDDWQGLLFEDMKKRLNEALWPIICGEDGSYCNISRNPAKAIWSEMSVLYNLPPQRATPGDKNATSEAYKALLDGTLFDLFLAEAELELAAFNDLVMWPSTARDDTGRVVLEHNKIAGDQCTVVYDPELGGERKPWAVVMLDQFADAKANQFTRYRILTRDWRMAFDDQGKRLGWHTMREVPPIPEPGDDDWTDLDVGIVNPLGLRHLVFAHRFPFSKKFWSVTPDDDLVELALDQGRFETNTTDQKNRAGHKQIVLTGDSIHEAEPQMLDVSQIIKLKGTNLTATVVEWSPDFEARTRVQDAGEARAAAMRGINPERLRRSYQTDAQARNIEASKHEQRAKTQPLWVAIENRYMRACKLVAGLMRMPAAADIDVAQRLKISYVPTRAVSNPKEQAETDGVRVEQGVQHPAEPIMREDPSLTKEQAMAELKGNIKAAAEVDKLKRKAQPKPVTVKAPGQDLTQPPPPAPPAVPPETDGEE